MLLRFDGSPVVLLLLGSLQACVIPLGPDFQDPTAAKNYPPEILNPSPPFLFEVTDSNPTFRVTVTDPNGGDKLFIRWFSDLPAPAPNTTRRLIPLKSVIPATGSPQSTPIDISPTCLGDRIASGISLHTIVLMVGDSDFDDQNGSSDATLLLGGGHAVVGGWLLKLDCPPL